MKPETLTLLKRISEQLATWSLNGRCLDAGNITSHEQTELDRLEFKIEEAIITEDETWLDA